MVSNNLEILENTINKVINDNNLDEKPDLNFPSFCRLLYPPIDYQETNKLFDLSQNEIIYISDDLLNWLGYENKDKNNIVNGLLMKGINHTMFDQQKYEMWYRNLTNKYNCPNPDIYKDNVHIIIPGHGIYSIIVQLAYNNNHIMQTLSMLIISFLKYMEKRTGKSYFVVNTLE